VRGARASARPHARIARGQLTIVLGQTAMVRHYVAKTPARAAGVAESAVAEYYRLKATKAPAPLKNAAFGRVKEPTLCGWVKGHATAETALAALAARRRRGGQTCLPSEVEKALALTIVTQWKAGLTLTKEQVLAMATIEAIRRGAPFQVRLRAGVVSWGFGLSPSDRMPPIARPAIGTTASATCTSCPASVPSVPARSTGRRRRARPIWWHSSKAQNCP
jgi:hypothetical protein